MIDQVGGKALPPEVLAQVLARTDGVPLFVEELTKAVLESGLLRDEGDRYALAGPLPPLAIPSTLQDSLMARLDRLAPVKEVAQVAAVIGREFAFDLLAAVVPPDGDLRAALDQLVAAELVFRRGEARTRSSTRWCGTRRTRACSGPTAAAARPDRGSAGGTLPRRGRAQPELLAQHYAGAGLAERAITYWLTAARLALARSANAEAVAQLDKGRPCWASYKTTLAGTGSSWTSRGPRRRAHRRQRLRGAGDRARLGTGARALPGPARHPAAPARPLRRVGLSPHLCRAGRGAQGRRRGPHPRQRGRRPSAPPDGAPGARQHVGVAWRGVRGRAELERALAIDLPPDRRLGLEYTFHPRVSSLGFIGWALVALGYPDQALNRAREAVATARELRNPNSLAQALFFNSSVAQLLGDRQESGRFADELEALAEQHGFPFWLAAARVMRGRALADGGETEAGLNLMRSGVDAYTATGGRDFRPYFRALLAEAALGPDPAAAGDVLTRILEEVGATGGRWIEPELHRLRGELLLAGPEPDLDGAETAFVRAVAVAARYRMRLWELRAATSLARVYERRGATGRGGDLLARLHGWFTEGLETPDLRRAKAALG